MIRLEETYEKSIISLFIYDELDIKQLDLNLSKSEELVSMD